MNRTGMTISAGIKSIKEKGFFNMQEQNEARFVPTHQLNLLLLYHNIRGHEAEAMTKRATAISRESGCTVYEAVQQLVADRQKAVNALRLRVIAAGLDVVKFDSTPPAMQIKSNPKDRERKPIPEKMLKACKERKKQRAKKN